jgi:hypothetical protein
MLEVAEVVRRVRAAGLCASDFTMEAQMKLFDLDGDRPPPANPTTSDRPVTVDPVA